MNSHGMHLQQISLNCEECSEKDQRIAQLEAERVPDELLIKLISGYRYNEDLQPIIDADAILAKRKG